MSQSKIRSKIAGKVIGRGGADVYAPLFDGLTQYAQLDSSIIIPEGVDFEISVVASGILLDGYRTVFSGPAVENFYRTIPDGGGVQVFAGNYGVSWLTSGFKPEDKHTYSLVRIGSDISILIDDDVKASRSTSVESVAVDRLLRSWSTSARTKSLLYSLDVSIGGEKTSSIAFNQKDSAIQAASVGSINATIVNHTPAMWVKV